MKITEGDIRIYLKVMKMMEQKDIKITDWNSMEGSVEIQEGDDRGWLTESTAKTHIAKVLNRR